MSNTFAEKMCFNEFLQQRSNAKVWQASKDEVLKIWNNLSPENTIQMTPMRPNKSGLSKRNRSYGEDGIRVTGNWPFVLGVMSRLKDVISYENDMTRLRLVLKQIDKSRDPNPGTPSYAFYANLENRGKGKR